MGTEGIRGYQDMGGVFRTVPDRFRTEVRFRGSSHVVDSSSFSAAQDILDTESGLAFPVKPLPGEACLAVNDWNKRIFRRNNRT